MSILNPTANITVNKSRLKIHDSKNIFMEDGTSFEVELFNPTQKTVLAKISLNGKLISSSGIVIEPGQRAFLERYFDNPKKFKFSTYEVEKGNSEVTKAIEKNGLVEIHFYNEQEIIPINNSFYLYTNTGFNQLYSNNLNGHIGTTCTYTTNSSDVTMDSFSDILRSSKSNTRSLSKSLAKTEETGRVGTGEKSNQSFDFSNKSFNTWINNTVQYKILPKSKEVEVKNEMNFCPSCGRKNKGYKFCPSCGKEL